MSKGKNRLPTTIFQVTCLAFWRASVYSSMFLFSHDILKRYHETKSWVFANAAPVVIAAKIDA